MKITLYLFAFCWFLLGLVALFLGQQSGLDFLQEWIPGIKEKTALALAIATWFWVFCLPALLAAAWAALLNRIDKLRGAVSAESDSANSASSYPVQTAGRQQHSTATVMGDLDTASRAILRELKEEYGVDYGNIRLLILNIGREKLGDERLSEIIDSA